jgi:uncharacterized membrane protein YbhN (UPF0104 family)
MSDESSTAPAPLSPASEAAPSSAKTVSKFRWSIHLAIMAALPVVAGFAGASSRGNGPALTNNVRGLLIVTGLEVLFFALLFGLAWLFSRATRDDLLLRWRPGYWVVPLGVIYSVAISFRGRHRRRHRCCAGCLGHPSLDRRDPKFC